MRILVTGHNGFIGSNMITALRPHHEVTTFTWGDPFPRVQGLDWVIHIGAISSTTERKIEKIMIQNYDFSVNLLEDCRRHGVNFQYSSSASIYGMGTNFTEDAPPDPRNPYAWSKYLFERYALRNQGGIYIQGFRYFNVYGPNEEHKGTQASPFCQFRLQAERTGQIKVFAGSEDFKRDFIHVSKVIDTHIKFFAVPESGTWNVGAGATMSFIDIAKLYKAEIIEIPMPEVLQGNYQKYTCANMSKTKATIQKYYSP